jgi:hypothetical protein
MLRGKNLISYEVQKAVGLSFDNFRPISEEGVSAKLASFEITYENLENEVQRLIDLTKEDKKFENFHSLFVFGPTGNSKSEIIKQMAEKNACIYHKLEIQKIPIEVFEGFPIIKKDEDGNERLKLVPSNLLPPSDDENVWLLHFDEFNKADTSKMAAVMNLVLTGEIGGVADYNKKTGKSEKYRLPQKTIIIGCGNFKTQESVENMNMVNSMDIATSERFHRSVLLDYDAEGWLKNFALKEYSFLICDKKYTLSTRIPGIILNFIAEKMLDEGKKAPFLIPISINPEEGGSERTASPRTWTLISDNMILDGLKEFESLEDIQEYEEMSMKVFETKERAFDMYMLNPDNQIRLLANQIPEFGIGGNKIIQEIVSKYTYYSLNRITPQNIIFEYENVRNKVKEMKGKSGAVLNLIVGMATEISLMKVEDYEEKEIKKMTVRINTFFEDMKVPSEDLSVFIHMAGKNSNKLFNDIHKMLNGISERYQSASGDYFHTSKGEILAASQDSIDIKNSTIIESGQ